MALNLLLWLWSLWLQKGRNGSNITNAAADLVINTQGAGFSLVYSGDATTGWTYREK